jgi:hypothetical protein
MLVAVPLWAEQAQTHAGDRTPPSNWWRTSVVALISSSAFDAYSSVGRPEVNPILRGSGGRFTARSIAIKALITGSALGVQWLLLKKRPDMAPVVVSVNVSMTAVNIYAGVHNTRLRRRESALPHSAEVSASFEVTR